MLICCAMRCGSSFGIIYFSIFLTVKATLCVTDEFIFRRMVWSLSFFPRRININRRRRRCPRTLPNSGLRKCGCRVLSRTKSLSHSDAEKKKYARVIILSLQIALIICHITYEDRYVPELNYHREKLSVCSLIIRSINICWLSNTNYSFRQYLSSSFLISSFLYSFLHPTNRRCLARLIINEPYQCKYSRIIWNIKHFCEVWRKRERRSAKEFLVYIWPLNALNL